MLGVVSGIFALYWFLLEKAPFGLKVKAIREDDQSAMSLGLNPTWIKLQAFILSAVPTGILGAIYAYWITYIDPASVLGDLVTDQAVVMAVFGGLGTLIGPAIGAIIIFLFKTYFWAYLSDYQVLYLIILGGVRRQCRIPPQWYLGNDNSLSANPTSVKTSTDFSRKNR